MTKFGLLVRTEVYAQIYARERIKNLEELKSLGLGNDSTDKEIAEYMKLIETIEKIDNNKTKIIYEGEEE